MAWPEFLFIFVVPERGVLPESESSLFVSLMQNRQWIEAVKFYEAVLRVKADYPPAVNALAMVAYENLDYETAFNLTGGLLKRFPENPVWLNNFALVTAARGDLPVARDALQQALQISSEHSAISFNSASLFVSEGNPLVALSLFRQLVDDDSCRVRALFAVSRLAKEQGLADEAIAVCRRLVDLFPDNAEFRQNLGLMLLKKGEWEAGFKLYEARWRANKLTMPTPECLWQGQELLSERLLVWAEQGFGDTINFACYLPLLQRRVSSSGRVVVAVQAPLLKLFQHSFPEFEIVELGKIDTLKYDYQVPLLSLPLIFGARPEKLPVMPVPYLSVDREYRKKWRSNLINVQRLRVGVVWRSNPVNVKEGRRAVPLSVFSRIFSCREAVFYGLQKEVDSQDAELLRTLFSATDNKFFDLSAELNDFQDTAAILQNLDLLISCDTSVPHLAGALACPVWLLLPFDADWRWLLGREDSPWYPTMRIFRQPEPGDWDSAIDKVCACLHYLAEGRLS